MEIQKSGQSNTLIHSEISQQLLKDMKSGLKLRVPQYYQLSVL